MRRKEEGRSERLQEERLLKEAEVARRWDMSVKTLQNDRVNGTGLEFIKIGRAVRYRLSAVEAFERAHTRRSTSQEDS